MEDLDSTVDSYYNPMTSVSPPEIKRLAQVLRLTQDINKAYNVAHQSFTQAIRRLQQALQVIEASKDITKSIWNLIQAQTLRLQHEPAKYGQIISEVQKLIQLEPPEVADIVGQAAMPDTIRLFSRAHQNLSGLVHSDRWKKLLTVYEEQRRLSRRVQSIRGLEDLQPHEARSEGSQTRQRLRILEDEVRDHKVLITENGFHLACKIIRKHPESRQGRQLLERFIRIRRGDLRSVAVRIQIELEQLLPRLRISRSPDV